MIRPNSDHPRSHPKPRPPAKHRRKSGQTGMPAPRTQAPDPQPNTPDPERRTTDDRKHQKPEASTDMEREGRPEIN